MIGPARLVNGSPYPRTPDRSSRRAPPAPAPAPPPPAVSARRIRGPSESRRVRGCRSRMARSSSANPPSGPIRISMPSAPAGWFRSASSGLVASAASSQKTSRRWASRARQIAIERQRLGDLGKAEDAALLGSLDDIGAHPLAVDATDLGEAGQDRLQRRGAHLDGLLHHVVEPGVFQRREDVGDIGQAILRPGLGGDIQTVGPFASRDRSLPFAVASVEHQDGLAGGKPQHIAEIIALVALQRDRFARPPARHRQTAGDFENRIEAWSMFQFGAF